MNCPRCDTVVLDERDREGIVVDSCPTCRGIWLDRGELEKLIARAMREIEELADRPPAAPSGVHDAAYADRDRPPADSRYDRPPADARYDRPPASARYDRPPPYEQDHRRRDHDDDYYRRYPKRKKHWLEAIGDIFD